MLQCLHRNSYRPTTEAQEPTDILVLLPLRDLEIVNLPVITIPLPNLQQLLHSRMSFMFSLEQENSLLWDPCILRRRHGNLHRPGHGKQELSLRDFQRISHFLRIVSGRSPRHHTTGSQGTQHGNRVPDGIGGEEGDGLALLEAVFLLQGC